MSEPIRVLHIFAPNYKYRFGGQNVYWKSVFSRWNDSKTIHRVLDTEKNMILEAREAFDFEYSNKQKMISKWKLITWFFSLYRNLSKYQKDFDTIHVHFLWWGGLLLGLWAKQKKIPAIFESVLLDEDSPNGIAHQKLGCLKLWLLKKYSGILTISNALTVDYQNYGFPPFKIYTLMNSVDNDIFHPVRSDGEKRTYRSKYSLPEDAKILIFVGSVIWRKGVDLLIEAFIEAQSEEENLYLVLVGARNKYENPSIDEEFIRNLQTTIRERGLNDKVKFIGLIQDRDQLAEIYRASDIFVFPSRNEGLGNVVLEAMACALPVVVSRLPVLEKVIQDGENGFFVPLEDAGSLIKAIVSIAQNPILAGKIGQAARQYVVASHGFEEWQRQLQQVYRRLLP